SHSPPVSLLRAVLTASPRPLPFSEVVMRRLSVLLVVLLCVSASRAEDAPRKVTAVEGVSEYRLSNGARVQLFLEASQPTVTVNLTVLVGSRHEGYGETGMAHL